MVLAHSLEWTQGNPLVSFHENMHEELPHFQSGRRPLRVTAEVTLNSPPFKSDIHIQSKFPNNNTSKRFSQRGTVPVHLLEWTEGNPFLVRASHLKGHATGDP